MPTLTISEARSLVEASMAATGHTPQEAWVIADHIIDCELRGLAFGGLPRALSVIERIKSTAIAPTDIQVIKETAISASIDGGDQVGYVVGRMATEMAIKKAQASGIAVVGARNTWYTGMFSYYLELAAAAGLVGIVAGSSAPFVAPYGGTEGRFGTNPIAFGFPTAGDPVIWDIGTSAVMYGEVVLKNRLDESLAEGLAYDASGSPTTDPAAALAGAFTVWGGHKGSGLAMVVQLLGMMTGASSAPTGVSDVGFFLALVDPDLLTSSTDYQARVASYAESMRSTRPADPANPVRVPFDRSLERRRQTLNEGSIEVSQPVYDGLTAASALPA